MRRIILLISFLSASLITLAQRGVIEGKVTDSKTGQPLAGVSVIVKSTKKGTSTNVDGNYSLTAEGEKVSLIFSYDGVTQQVDDIVLQEGKVSLQNLALTQREKTEEAVVVRAVSTARKETAASLITFQKNTNTVAQVISAESIRRSPDKNTGDVLKRVPGTSVQEGKYLVVRGLADRYNQAMLNGILLSSTEPDRKTFSFDIIPSNMIDNIIINKAFVPELPGEWAGGLIQVNTKDVPSKNFFNVQIGTGFNTNTIGKDFYTYRGGNTDFLGYDDGTRALPDNLPLKATFAALSQQEKTAYAPGFKNVWDANKEASSLITLNQSFQLNGGFKTKVGQNGKLAAILAINYNRSNRNLAFENRVNTFENGTANTSFDFKNNKYSQDVLAGALANITYQINSNNTISFKNILNVNTADFATIRTGKDFEGSSAIIGDNIKAYELAFKANTFYTTQLMGDHNIRSVDAKFHWFGSFNILDQYIPDQRRLQYSQLNSDPNQPYLAIIGSANTSQKSGSRYYGFLNDYNYTTGADVSKTFKIKSLSQSVKAGYFFQVKDRLFDSRPFAIYLPSDNQALRALSPSEIFNAGNFGNGTDNKFAFNELSGGAYRYIANSILNAGFLQLDNQISNKLRVVWGLRVEDFDQIVGSLKKSDPRHVYSRVRDYLPGLNATYKVTNKTNFRVSASQTVVRPEFRELSTFQFFDFELGSTVAGNTGLQRTKISNFDLRYELYPRAGELFTLGVFYKYFKNPIEAFFNAGTGGGSYNFVNAQEANSFGAEVEFRKKLDFDEALKNFTVQGNVSYIYNRVSQIGEAEQRPMQGQSPYLLNLGIQYDLEKLGLNTTLLFNQIGRRIAFVGGTNDQPAIWENPRPVLDLQVAKKVLKERGEVKLNVSDIINKRAIFYNDLDKNKKFNEVKDNFSIKRNYGTNISLSFGYNF